MDEPPLLPSGAQQAFTYTRQTLLDKLDAAIARLQAQRDCIAADSQESFTLTNHAPELIKRVAAMIPLTNRNTAGERIPPRKGKKR